MIGASLARPRVHDQISGHIFDLQEYIFLSYAPCAYRYMYYEEIFWRILYSANSENFKKSVLWHLHWGSHSQRTSNSPNLVDFKFVCLLRIYRPTRKFFTHVKTSPLPDKGLQILTYAGSAFMAIEQWWFFSVPNLLWHVASVYNCHVRGPVTLAPTAMRLAVELSITTCFYDLDLSRLGFEHAGWTLYPTVPLLRAGLSWT